MFVIRNKDGEVIQRSQNLSGVRAYSGKNSAKTVSIDKIGLLGKEGKLCILFWNGSSFECNLASYNLLKETVRCWRNLKGATLIVDGVDAGQVESKNLALVS